MADETVLVTGGTGFLATRCLAQALNEGHRVRTTVRNAAAAEGIREQLAEAGAPDAAALGVVTADLTADAGWAEAVAGCTRVLHTASPMPWIQPQDPDEVIVPARDGTIRVLRAARDAGVRRVVFTSSFGAVGYGHKDTKRPFTEEDWTDLDDPTTPPTIRSKTLAEMAAWDFIAREGGDLELTVVNPAGIFGPVLGPRYSSAISLLLKLIDGTSPAVVPVSFSVVDVRDVADLHLRAMVHPAAAGQRFIASGGDAIGLDKVATMLRKRLGPDGDRVPTKQMPMWMFKAAAKMAPGSGELAANVGKVRRLTNAKARETFGWTPRSMDDTLVETARSLLDRGLVGAPLIMG